MHEFNFTDFLVSKLTNSFLEGHRVVSVQAPSQFQEEVCREFPTAVRINSNAVCWGGIYIEFTSRVQTIALNCVGGLK